MLAPLTAEVVIRSVLKDIIAAKVNAETPIMIIKTVESAIIFAKLGRPVVAEPV